MNGALPAADQVLTPDEIIDLQMRGMVQQAHDAYVAYFHANEIDFALLSLFGVCCRQLGKDEKAENLFRHIVQEAPFVEEAHAHLAEILCERGDKTEALAILDSDAICNSTNLVVRTLRGKLLADMQNWQRAAEDLTFAHQARPEDVSIILALAEIERLMQHQERVKDLLALAVFHQPTNVEVLMVQAEMYMGCENYEAAIGNYTRITDARPHYIEAGIQKCKALETIKDYKGYLEEAERLAALEPDDVIVLVALIEAYRQAEDYVGLIQAASHLLRCSPGNRHAEDALAHGYFCLGKYEKCLTYLDRVLAKNPDDASALSSKGVCFEKLFRIDEALECFDRAIAIKPDLSLVSFNKSMCALLKGDFHTGFALYEDRLSDDPLRLRQYLGSEPDWDGVEEIRGKHILVHPEQGYGDTLMAARFVKQLEGDGAKVTFAVQKPLVDIMKTLDTDCTIIAKGDQVGKIDFQCSLMSLANVTSNRWKTLPAYEHYLAVPEEAATRWATRFAPASKPRIGFVCSGNPLHKNDHNRSMPMSLLLDSLPQGGEYHLLQKDLRPTDVAALSTRDDIIRHDQEIGSFADTAAICKQMDLVISVDTSVAHLAGALGCNLLVMVPLCGDWRWGMDPVKSTWYPSANIVRQQALGDWSHVLNTISLRVESMIAVRQ